MQLSVKRVLALASFVCCLLGASRAHADSFSDRDILGNVSESLRLKEIGARATGFSQHGQGFQSRARAELSSKGVWGRGSERLTVFEPQLDATFTQGPRIQHRVWIPVDVVTAASPDAVDMVSAASRQNVAGTVALATTLKTPRLVDLTVHELAHFEENYRAWGGGFVLQKSFAEDNTVVAMNGNTSLDTFNRYRLSGKFIDREHRNTNNGNLGVTQLLSPTTLAHVNYGITVQEGLLTNSWNSVPFALGGYVAEAAPRDRVRHAAVARVSQWLPWNGAAKAFYRFYGDTWGVVAHTFEGELNQRLTPTMYLRANYRVHQQNGARFFTERAFDLSSLRVSDSDLAEFATTSVKPSAVA